mgnify:FL=1
MLIVELKGNNMNLSEQMGITFPPVIYRDFSAGLAKFPSYWCRSASAHGNEYTEEALEIARRHRSADSLGLSNRTAIFYINAVCAIADAESNSIMQEMQEVPYVDNKGEPLSYHDLTIVKRNNRVLHEHFANNRKIIERVVNVMHPNYDADHCGFSVLWIDEKGRDAGRDGRLMLRSGKALRKMFPCLTDKEVENINDAYRQEFSVKGLTLKQGAGRQHFAHAYSHTIGKLENPSTEWHRKNLGNSCMRYSFDRLDCHPTEAYGSGEFTMFWTEEASGKIASRCVVWQPPQHAGNPEYWVAAPVYGVCDASIDLIQNHLSGLGCGVYRNSSSWAGAKLLCIKNGSETSFVGPYLDVDPKALTHGDEGFFIVESGGAVRATTYQGVLFEQELHECTSCGDEVTDDDVMHWQDDVLCSSCYDENTFNCCQCGDTESSDESITINTTYGQEMWCTNCQDNHAVLIDSGDWWQETDTEVTNCGIVISQDELDDGQFFISNWNGEIYKNDKACRIDNGDIVSLVEILRHNKRHKEAEYEPHLAFIKDDDELPYQFNSETDEWTQVIPDDNETSNTESDVAYV